MSAQPATPLPWHQGPIDGGDNANNECVFDADGEIVADCGARSVMDNSDDPFGPCIQNAAYVTAACNGHNALIDQLRDVLDYLEPEMDADLQGESYVPNRAMSLYTDIEMLLKKYGGKV
jgi:hypothetical protein